MNFKNHRIPAILIILGSLLLVEVAHQYGECIAEIFVEHSHDTSSVPASAPDLLEETAKEKYLYIETISAENSDIKNIVRFENHRIESLFEQNVLVPPPDNSI